MAQQLVGWFVIFQKILTRIAKNPIFFVIFQGRGSGHPAPPPSGSVFADCPDMAIAVDAGVINQTKLFKYSFSDTVQGMVFDI